MPLEAPHSVARRGTRDPCQVHRWSRHPPDPRLIASKPGPPDGSVPISYQSEGRPEVRMSIGEEVRPRAVVHLMVQFPGGSVRCRAGDGLQLSPMRAPEVRDLPRRQVEEVQLSLLQRFGLTHALSEGEIEALHEDPGRDILDRP